MKDYRISHASVAKAERYEHEIYRRGAYDDLLWQEEKKILAHEVTLLSRRVGDVAYLDFACGSGRILAFLEERVASALGVDPARPMLDLASQKIKKAKFISTDLTQTDTLRGAQYDLITAFRFFLNAQPELRACAFDVLAPKLKDGKSLLIFNIHGNLMSYRLCTKLWYWLRGRRLNAMTVRGAKKLAREHGLSVVRWRGIGVIPKTLFRLAPASVLAPLDRALEKLPGMRYISYDLVFVCQKN